MWNLSCKARLVATGQGSHISNSSGRKQLKKENTAELNMKQNMPCGENHIIKLSVVCHLLAVEALLTGFTDSG